MKLSIVLFLVLVYSIPTIYATITIISSNDTLVDRIAAFGPRIELQDELRGKTEIPSSDMYGCSRVGNMTNKIALIERGSCSFIQKVKYMQDSGAIAVIVGDRHFNGWVTMYAPGDTSEITIPSVFVAQHQYNILLAHNQQDVIISGDDLLTWPLLDMLLVVVLSPAVMMLFIYLTWQLRQRQKKKNDIAPSNIVTKLPTYSFKQEKIVDKEHIECAICLDEYQQNDLLRILPCKHEFHKNCIDNWLTEQKKWCPLCKHDITIEFHIKSPLLSTASNNYQSV